MRWFFFQWGANLVNTAGGNAVDGRDGISILLGALQEIGQGLSGHNTGLNLQNRRIHLVTPMWRGKVVGFIPQTSAVF